MIVPILNKESTAQELANLCWLLIEANAVCDDKNIRWKIAQLAGTADELNEKFLDEHSLQPLNPSKHQKDFIDKLSEEEKLEILLSFAFQSAATLDYAQYKEFEPSKKFSDTIKLISREALTLLHEKRRWRKEEESSD